MGPSFKKGISPIYAAARFGIHGHAGVRWTGGKDHQKPRGCVGEKNHRASCRLVLVVRDRANAFRPKTACQNEER